MATQDGAAKIADGDQLDDGFFNDTSGVITVEAGETIAVGDVCFIYLSGHASEGEAWLSDADVADKNRATGIAVSAGNDGDDIQLQTSGRYVESAAFIDKETYYLSTTAGAFSTTRSGVRIGIALSANELFISIVQDEADAVGTIKAYHISATTIPSNNLTAFWQLMDGTTISDSESPIDGDVMDDLNAGNRFLRGADTSGGTGGVKTDTAGGASAGGDVSHQLDANLDNQPPFFDVAWIIKKK